MDKFLRNSLTDTNLKSFFSNNYYLKILENKNDNKYSDESRFQEVLKQIKLVNKRKMSNSKEDYYSNNFIFLHLSKYI